MLVIIAFRSRWINGKIEFQEILLIIKIVLVVNRDKPDEVFVIKIKCRLEERDTDVILNKQMN